MTLSSEELIHIDHNPYKQDFPLLASHPDIAFLDSAATTQRLGATLDAERSFYETMNANPLRGLYRLSVEATQAIDAARRHVAAFIGATKDGKPQAQEIIFTRNASESLNIVAQSFGGMVLRPGDEVVISIMEHHSNLIPWQQICAKTGAKLVYLRLDNDYRITNEELDNKIGPKTKIVAITQVSNVLGIENDIKAIAQRAHDFGAYVVVDGAQSVPHIAVNVAELGCDFMAFSAHKMCGPMGIGVLWGKSELLNAMPPFLTGGEMIDSVSEDGAVWAPIPEKFEAGTQDAAGIFAFDAALDYLDKLGMDTLAERERALCTYLCDSLNELDFVDVIGPREGSRHHGPVAFNVHGVHPHDVASILDGSGVCIRAGHHCAQPLLTYLDVAMGSTCRASIAFYNDKNDIDRLIDALKTVWTVFNG